MILEIKDSNGVLIFIDPLNVCTVSVNLESAIITMCNGVVINTTTAMLAYIQKVFSPFGVYPYKEQYASDALHSRDASEWFKKPNKPYTPPPVDADGNVISMVVTSKTPEWPNYSGVMEVVIKTSANITSLNMLSSNVDILPTVTSSTADRLGNITHVIKATVDKSKVTLTQWLAITSVDISYTTNNAFNDDALASNENTADVVSDSIIISRATAVVQTHCAAGFGVTPAETGGVFNSTNNDELIKLQVSVNVKDAYTLAVGDKIEVGGTHTEGESPFVLLEVKGITVTSSPSTTPDENGLYEMFLYEIDLLAVPVLNAELPYTDGYKYFTSLDMGNLVLESKLNPIHKDRITKSEDFKALPSKVIKLSHIDDNVWGETVYPVDAAGVELLVNIHNREYDEWPNYSGSITYEVAASVNIDRVTLQCRNTSMITTLISKELNATSYRVPVNIFTIKCSIDKNLVSLDTFKSLGHMELVIGSNNVENDVALSESIYSAAVEHNLKIGRTEYVKQHYFSTEYGATPAEAADGVVTSTNNKEKILIKISSNTPNLYSTGDVGALNKHISFQGKGNIGAITDITYNIDAVNTSSVVGGVDENGEYTLHVYEFTLGVIPTTGLENPYIDGYKSFVSIDLENRALSPLMDPAAAKIVSTTSEYIALPQSNVVGLKHDGDDEWIIV